MLIAALCAYAIANVFTMSAFNTVLSIKNMPYLPFMFTANQYKKKTGDFYEQIKYVLTEKATVYDILGLLLAKEAIIMDEFIPVVDNLVDRKVIGSVRTLDLIEYLKFVSIRIHEDLTERYKKLRRKESVSNDFKELMNSVRKINFFRFFF